MSPIDSTADLFTGVINVQGPFCYLMSDEPRKPIRMVFFPWRQFHIGAQFVKWAKTRYVVELYGDNGQRWGL